MLPTLAEPVSYNAEKNHQSIVLITQIDRYLKKGRGAQQLKHCGNKNEEDLLGPWQPVIVQCYNEKLVCLNDV